jgi:hypothetical protein
MRRYLSVLILVAAALFVFLPTKTASAIECAVDGVVVVVAGDKCPNPQELADLAAGKCDPDKSVLGIPTWYKYLEGEVVAGKCRPIIDTESGDAVSVGKALPIGLAILEIMMTLGGLVAVVMIFVGSFKFIIAQGESAKINEAKNTVINSIVGLVIVIVATRIVSFIGNRLG